MKKLLFLFAMVVGIFASPMFASLAPPGTEYQTKLNANYITYDTHAAADFSAHDFTGGKTFFVYHKDTMPDSSYTIFAHNGKNSSHGKKCMICGTSTSASVSNLRNETGDF